MSKKEFLCDFYNVLKTDIIGVIDETFRYYDVCPYGDGIGIDSNFLLRLDLCKQYVRRPSFRNLCFCAFTIVNYLDYIPLGAFDSKKVSASALTNIYLFNSLNYGKQKK